MRSHNRALTLLVILALLIGVAAAISASAAPVETSPAQAYKGPTPRFTTPRAFDISPALRDMAKKATPPFGAGPDAEPVDVRPDRGPLPIDQGFSGDGAINDATASQEVGGLSAATISAPLMTFEGLNNTDNYNLFGFRVNPPDPVGDVGPNHYVEMVNLAFAVYDKQGNLLLGPVDTGTLWSGFPVEDCTDPSGDPIVVYDQLVDRWILTQFTTRFTAIPENDVFYNCVAVSQTADPTGAYYRYAFTSGNYFPDYPKYGVWTDSYILTSRDFGPTDTDYGVSVYALEKYRMISGNPNARAVQFFLDSSIVPTELFGDGLLPPDIDGSRRPIDGTGAPV